MVEKDGGNAGKMQVSKQTDRPIDIGTDRCEINKRRSSTLSLGGSLTFPEAVQADLELVTADEISSGRCPDARNAEPRNEYAAMHVFFVCFCFYFVFGGVRQKLMLQICT